MLGENELRYLSGCDNVLAVVASVVCSDGSDSIRDHLQEDHFQLSTPSVGGDLQGIPHNQELDGGKPRGLPLNQELSALEEYRRRDSVGRYPLLLRHLWAHGSMWLAEDGERRPRGASQGEMLSRVLSDLLLLDRTSRVCLLLNPDLDQCQQVLLQRAARMIENQQWSEFMKFSETVRCFGLNQSSCSELRLLHDYCMCCALTRDLENASSEKSASWRPLLKICESELKCRMILGTLHHWDQDVCLQLLKTCLQRGDTETTALQKLLVRRLNEMKVYRKITSCAREVLSKLDQSEHFTISGKFSQTSDNNEDSVVIETEDATNQVLTDLCRWQGVVDISSESPAFVIEVLTYAKDFATAYEWAHIYGVHDQFELVLKEVHVTSLLEKCPTDVVAAYQVLNELREQDSGRCFEVCNNLTLKLSSRSHVLCVVDYMINQLRDNLGQRRLSQLTMMSIGLKAVLCLPPKDQSDYEHLASSPMLLLEQLLMNNKLEWAKLVLKIYSDAVQHVDPDTISLTATGCNELLEEYATKALDFAVPDHVDAPASGSLSRSPSKTSIMSGVSSAPWIHRRHNTMSSLAALGPISRDLASTGLTGGAPGSLPVSATIANLGHVSGAQTSTPVSFRNNPVMEVPFIMPVDPPHKSQWVPDSAATVCMVCRVERFNMFNRRHHCRRCGRVVCGSCSMKTIIICGKSSRACDQCYRQIYPSKNASDHMTDLQRLRDRLSGVSPDGSLVSQRRGIGITIGSGSPDQNQPMIDLDFEQTPHTCAPFLYVLSLDDELNNSTREEFYYDYAPSTSLCLSLLDLHGSPQRCADVLLKQCEQISRHLQPEALGVRNPEVDYGLVISMMKTMLMSAKIRFIKSDDTGGVSQCDVYIDRVNLLDQLLTNNCSYIPSVHQLTKPDTLRHLRDSLIQEERFNLAMDVSTKCGLDSVGVWVAWGKACIRIGDYSAARDKFAKCLKAPVDLNQIQTPSTHKILSDVIDCLESTSNTSQNKFLDNLVTIKTLLANPAQKPVEDLSEEDPMIDECLYYLREYGSHVSMVTFYRRHKLLMKAAHYILDKKCSSEVFLEGLFLPGVSSGSISQLLEQLYHVDPSLDKWLIHLTAACKHLTRTRQMHMLYHLQIFMKDYLRAAMTCIQQFYQSGTASYTDLHARLSSLNQAKKLMDSYLGERHWDSRIMQHVARDAASRLILTPMEVNKYVYTIEMQTEVTKFLYQYHDNYERITSNKNSEAMAASSTAAKTMFGTSPTHELPTLFGSSKTKGQVASLILLCGNNVHDGYGLAFRIIQHFKLDAESIYTQVSLLCARLRLYSGIRQLLSCIRESGMCSDALHDEVISVCVKVIGTNQSDIRELESLIKMYRNDSNKIDAYIVGGKLKSAYLLAVKLGSLDDVRRIHQVAVQTDQHAVSAICQQYIQKQQGKR